MNHRISETTRLSPILTQSPALAHIPMLWKVYRDLRVKKRDSQIEKWVKKSISVVKGRWEGKTWRDDPIFRGYVSLHDRYMGEKNIPSSCEVLLDFVHERGSIPHINTFVDIYNVVSIRTGVSIGAHDAKRIAGNPRLEILKEDTLFKPIGGRGEGLAKRGEYAYVDEQGVLCRMDIKQCDRTKIIEDTTEALVIFQGHEAIEEALIRESIRRLDESLKRFGVMVRTFP